MNANDAESSVTLIKYQRGGGWSLYPPHDVVGKINIGDDPRTGTWRELSVAGSRRAQLRLSRHGLCELGLLDPASKGSAADDLAALKAKEKEGYCMQLNIAMRIGG